MSLLDAGLRALRARNYDDANRSLDTYEQQFPRGILRTEADVLRIRILLAQGERSRAVAIGAKVLEREPESVHTRRIRALLTSPDEK